ncbi:MULTISPECIES: hypothetical protein [unclassified Streptomyces]|uniref:hypothetical protein n=1 Tax=unclassified Streptomyces TaxID=2593676 RepID=UPI0001C1C6DB|nr:MULTISPECIES: hypothetical protein [unclassified Streptomyces]MYR67630.1 hypothetical protein [Streptomyces sp. SID4939]MYR98904.1 hypothetical protein [Streptomyces sp. SID4940]MYT62099.1 hypothetical protein [Streptomyces sp. SID8357]MYT68040.1 hypothetical protein [Streptomyces sp. SID8357]MYT86313.1 hypothetical protein [Streptomyces sp. SID8360]
MADRLAQSTSPYLLQHADNPVGCRGSDGGGGDVVQVDSDGLLSCCCQSTGFIDIPLFA